MQLSWEPRPDEDPAVGGAAPLTEFSAATGVSTSTRGTEATGVPELVVPGAMGVVAEDGLCCGEGSSAVLDFGVGIVVDGPAVGGGSFGGGGWTAIDDGSGRTVEDEGREAEAGRTAASRRGDGGSRTRATASSSRSVSGTTADIDSATRKGRAIHKESMPEEGDAMHAL